MGELEEPLKFLICRFGEPLLKVSPEEIVEKFVPNGYSKAYDLYILPETVQAIKADGSVLSQGTIDALNNEQEHYFRRRVANPEPA